MKSKIMLSSLAIAAAATAIGGGTFASFHDTERGAENVSVTAGTLDLVVGGSAQTTLISASNVKPGDSSGTGQGYQLTNAGSLPGKLKVFLVKDADAENVIGEPEAEDGDVTSPNGELDNNLHITVDGNSFGPGGTVVAGLDTINVGQRLEITNQIWEGNPGPIMMPAGDSYPGSPFELWFGWTVNSGANDTIQSDSLGFHLEFELDQA